MQDDKPTAGQTLRGCLQLIVVAVVLFIGWIVWMSFRPDLYLNPADRFFMTQFDDRTQQDPKPLIPDVFSLGMTRQLFVQVIEGMGYSENDSLGEIPNELWYSKAGTFAIVCSTTFSVNAKFDDSGLQEAMAHRWSTCL